MTQRGQIILFCALSLLVIGVVMVNSAGMAVAPVDATGAFVDGARPVTLASILTSRPAVYAAAAMGAALLAAFAPAGVLERLGVAGRGRVLAGVGIALALVVLLLLAVYLPGIGRTMKGSHRWLSVPVIGSLQPSEVAKWAMIVLLAAGAVAVRRPDGVLGRGVVGLLAGLALVCGVIVLEDLGTAVLIAGAGVGLLIAAGMRLWVVIAAAPAAAVALAAAVLSSPYRVDRVVTFIDPFQDPRGDGYHMIQSMATIAGGGPFGRGLGHGLQKFGYLPEDTTDFLFAVICEELGLAGAACVATLYAVLFCTIAGVVRHAAGPVQRLVALGVLLTISGQAVMNLFVVTGLGPTKGIALPLLSAGGTGWVLTAFALGAVIAIDRAGRTAPAWAAPADAGARAA